MALWEKYFLKEFLKTFFLIIICFFGLYILIDYASHSSSKHYGHSSMHWLQLAKHYGMEFVLRAEILIPFALLISSIRTLFNLNVHNELAALQSAGIPLKKLMRPFLAIGFTSVLLIYGNHQFLHPDAMKSTQTSKQKNKRTNAVQSLALKDQTTFLYQSYDPQDKSFYDACWIRSFDEVWRFKKLLPYEKPPIAFEGERYTRDEEGKLKTDEIFAKKECPEIRFNKKELLDSITNPEALPLTDLWNKLSFEPTEKDAETASIFFQKITLPWLCLAAILFPAPACIRFSRTHSPFFIYSLNIFGLTACFLLLDAAAVLGSRQVLPSYVAIGFPFFLLMTLNLVKFLKIR